MPMFTNTSGYWFDFILVRISTNQVLDRDYMRCRSHEEASRIIKQMNQNLKNDLEYILA